MKRINILTGNLGSGKTEIAINLALMLMRQGKKAALVDLDIINPYFRTRLVADNLMEMGLRVVAPEGRLRHADLPAMSPAVKGVIEDGSVQGVFDVGGDDVGATALGRYRDLLLPGDFSLLFVVNTCRPFTRDTAGIIKYIDSIQKASGMTVDGLINNANLGAQTDVGIIEEGFKLVSKVAGELKLPVVFSVVKRSLEKAVRAKLGEKNEILPIETYMRPPWQGDAL